MFENAGQLVRDNDVQVGGRRVGSITDIELTDDNQAAVTVEGRGALRAAARGHRGDDPADVAVGHRQPLHRAGAWDPATRPSSTTARCSATNATTSVVDLDQIFNTLDAQTRGSLQDVIKGFATQYEGKEAEAGRRRSTSTRCCRPRAGSSAS